LKLEWQRKGVPKLAKSDPIQPCPVKTAVQTLGGKWKPLIIYYLLESRKLRFSELRRCIPEATQQMLTQQLRQLEADGVVSRKIFPVVPPKVEYSLTSLGQELGPIIALLGGWGENLLQLRSKALPSDRN
jgi:DNA-binding HxlR family transcriptional regulator